jgi:putative DNA primase/helicase
MMPAELERAFRLEVLATLGHAPEVIEPGKLQRFATRERRNDDAGWCLMFEDRRGGVYGCYRAGVQRTWTARDQHTLTPSERAELARQVEAATRQRLSLQRERWAKHAERNAELWEQCLPVVPGDPALTYLQRRGIVGTRPLPAMLRLHPALPYWHEGALLGTFPAMVAPLVGADGRMVALHRTYLTPEGRKADVPSVKKLSGAAGPLAGAAIRLYELAGRCMGIAEGIETALAAGCMTGLPMAAAYCAGNLATWRWPASLQRLVIFADADAAGQQAAETLRRRALVAGLRVELLAPTDAGADWCDVWAAREQGEAA